ncbi:hypothetical protein HPP92_021088 [Vanilla planifolia]|uniref:VTT domain-containing protein n=1 Tax=Vanilla planifolia TaxID=51239 RepID=A0A835Q7A4_VANPL|nr:hypothetical protein HPP92_021088 [Vanilla planifolia]
MALPADLAISTVSLLRITSARHFKAPPSNRLSPLRPAVDRSAEHLRQRVYSPLSSTSFTSARMLCCNGQVPWTTQAAASGMPPNGGSEVVKEMLEGWEIDSNHLGISVLAKLAIALGLAATVTLGSLCLRWSSVGSPFRLAQYVAGSSQTGSASSAVGFAFTFFGNKYVIPEITPGWVYFWLLMAAGCGLFISEEALNVWVGMTLARTLSLDGKWQSLMESFSRNAPHILSTVLWVYWGVCISDMIPFYLGRLFRQTKTSEDICSKINIGKAKAVQITRAVQKHGNLIGFVERFSVGARNPTAFFAGASGISPECFFAGVCCGGLFTLPIQLAVGFLLRERPVAGLAGVATVVGIWTVFPYLLAASTAAILYFRTSAASNRTES